MFKVLSSCALSAREFNATPRAEAPSIADATAVAEFLDANRSLVAPSGAQIRVVDANDVAL